jgi:competence ComEA-like helix-hairpin-helix protein
MTRRERYVLFGILAVFAVGLILHTAGRYRIYQNYIDLTPAPGTGTGAMQTGDASDEPATEAPDRQDSVGGPGEEESPPAREEERVLINVNSADMYELMNLPGIGRVTALNIIDYRTQIGPFSTIDELMEVKGIGEKKLEMLKQYVTIR